MTSDCKLKSFYDIAIFKNKYKVSTDMQKIMLKVQLMIKIPA